VCSPNNNGVQQRWQRIERRNKKIKIRKQERMDGQSLKLYSIRGVCPFAANSWAVLLLLAESPLQQARRQAPLLK
jgi:hypothetical protein